MLESSDEEEEEFAPPIVNSDFETTDWADPDGVITEEMRLFEEVKFDQEDKRDNILKKWKSLRKRRALTEFPVIMKAARDSLVISGGNSDAETTFSFVTISAADKRSCLKIGTLISEVFCKITNDLLDDTEPIPNIKNYDVFDDDFNCETAVECSDEEVLEEDNFPD